MILITMIYSVYVSTKLNRNNYVKDRSLGAHNRASTNVHHYAFPGGHNWPNPQLHTQGGDESTKSRLTIGKQAGLLWTRDNWR